MTNNNNATFVTLIAAARVVRYDLADRAEPISEIHVMDHRGTVAVISDDEFGDKYPELVILPGQDCQIVAWSDDGLHRTYAERVVYVYGDASPSRDEHEVRMLMHLEDTCSPDGGSWPWGPQDDRGRFGRQASFSGAGIPDDRSK